MRRGRTCADRSCFGKIKLMHFQIGLLDYLHAANVPVSYVQPLHVIRTGLADHDHFHSRLIFRRIRRADIASNWDKNVFFDRWPSTHRWRKRYDFPYSDGNHNVFYRLDCKSSQF